MAKKAEKVVTDPKAIPNLSNATPQGLVDQIGELRAEAKRLEFLEGVYKEALKARVTENELKGLDQILGEIYIGSYEDKRQERIDTAAVREHFANDPETLAKLFKEISYKQLNIKRKPA